MSGLLRWSVRHPFHAGVFFGLVIAIVFGIFSFPRDGEVRKTVSDWLPSGATTSQAQIDSLIEALESARSGDATLERVSEKEFRDLDLASSYAFPAAQDDGSFTIEYVGQPAEDSATVYLAERDVYAAPWWHPDRLLYRAVSYHVDSFGEGLSLTYKRDWENLGAVLLMDAIVGAIYGGLISLILAVTAAGGMPVPSAASPKQLPAEAPLKRFQPGKLPRSS